MDFQKIISDAGAKWTEAKKAGDKAGMDAAHAAAEKARSALGYSGGSDGSNYIKLEPEKPAYDGLSPEEFSTQLMQKAQAGVDASASQQITNINNNLAQLLSDLGAEGSKVNPEYDKAIQNIHKNEFNSTETSKELMNQSGWNANNSGLAIGEVDRIGIAADNDRADAELDRTATLADIARRVQLAQANAGNTITGINNWKSASMAGAAADAMLQADSRNYGQYRDSVGDFYTDRDYNHQVDREEVADQQWNDTFDWQKETDTRDFNYQKDQDTKNFNYQVTRDKVLDDRWLTQFNADQQQRIIDNAISNRQISVSEGNLALTRSRQNREFAKEDTFDSRYKSMMNSNDPEAWLEQNKGSMEAGSYASLKEVAKSDTLGALYGDMLRSPDPTKWLQENGQYLTDDELKAMLALSKKDSSSDSDSLAGVAD
jgi:hypothetical protein